MPIWSPAMIFGSASSGYVVEDSIWLDGAADYLERTPGSAGNLKVYTLSFWAKVADKNTSNGYILDAGAAGANGEGLRFTGASSSPILITGLEGDGNTFRTTSAIYRDPTAWMHVVYVKNTADSTADDRIKIFVNGARITDFSATRTVPLNEAGGAMNTTVTHRIGANIYSSTPAQFYGGYLAEYIFLDGVAGAATDFGEYDDNGVWVPIDPSGLTFGTNGFWLDFAIAPGTGAGSGNDVSGNNNDFTETSMTAAQQVTDSPTDDAENDIGNYATFNPLGNEEGGLYGGVANLAEGNTRRSAADGNWYNAYSTIAMNTTQGGKWYAEFECITSSAKTLYAGVALKDEEVSAAWQLGSSKAKSWAVYANDGKSYHNNTSTTGTGGALSNGDIIMVAYDADNETLYLGVNDSWFGSAEPDSSTSPTYSSVPTVSGDNVFFAAGVNGTTVDCKANFGNEAFTYTIPTGYKALSTANLPAPTVTNSSDFAKPVIYTGNGTAIGSGGKAVTGVGFQPDFVWIKNRDATDSHMLFDASRGVTKYISSDTTAASATDTESLSTFDSDGFTVGNNVAVNTNTEDYVAFCLKAGGAGSSNTDGSINTTKTSVATHGGFSINTYTGTGANATVGHGLSSEPQMIITKNLTDTDAWAVYHSSNTSAPETEYLVLNTNAATDDLATYWNDTAPTSSVFSIGSVTNTNGSSDSMVAYCFARTPGLIGIGSYIGNANTDGPYVVVNDGASGFKPAILITKGASSAGSWIINDASRSPSNVVNDHILADSNAVEATSTSNNYDFTANGFKVRSSNGDCNNSGSTIIYLAFAENPFGGSGVAQARAR